MQPSDRKPVTSHLCSAGGGCERARLGVAPHGHPARSRRARSIGTRRPRRDQPRDIFFTGVFSNATEQVGDRAPRARASGGADGPSLPDVEVPIDATFQMTATISDAIGVAADTEFVLASEIDLPVDAVRRSCTWSRRWS